MVDQHHRGKQKKTKHRFSLFYDGVAFAAPFYEQKESKMLEYMAIVFLINLSLSMMGVI